MIVCLIFHTAIIINSKNWCITIKLYFENLRIFFKKRTYTHDPASPSPPQRIFFSHNFLNDPLCEIEKLRDKASVKIWANTDIIFLTKNGHLSKSPKSELVTVKKLSRYTSTHWTETNDFHWFHGSGFYRCQKGSCKKKKKNWKLFMTCLSLWSTSKKLSATCPQVDIAFELYIKNRIKSQERDHRS